jgi:RNA polymerase sigma factor (sigma-70 family)
VRRPARSYGHRILINATARGAMTTEMTAAIAQNPGSNPGSPGRGGRVHDDVAALVHAARAGDACAWDAIVARFGGAIRAVTRGFRLSPADADDVMQTTWLRLLRNIHRLDDPAALKAWLVTTARRESLRALQGQMREIPTDDETLSARPDPATIDEQLAANERRRALRQAVDELPARPRILLRMLMASPDSSYEELGNALRMPVGSIGPTRGRCFNRLRSDPGLLGLVH